MNIPTGEAVAIYLFVVVPLASMLVVFLALWTAGAFRK